VDGRETRFEAATREEALDIARRFTKAFGATATVHLVRTERIAPFS
jgi:hypothetical protein